MTIKQTLALIGALGTLLLAPPAEAVITDVLGGAVSCSVQSGGNAGERHCAGIFNSFDGAPIDVNIGFPPEPVSGPDGDFPIIGIFHGWGGTKISLGSGSAQEWLDNGYAVFSMSDRGWGSSCGGLDPQRLIPGVCDNGYNHLMDTRYEVRDAQEVFESLADQLADGATLGEGLIHPQQIGSMGSSYGGGMSMALGVLKNRKMTGGEDPNPIDGTLVPWVSPGGKAMVIAAAQPDIPWSDLAYSLMPNGHTLDYVADAPYLARGRIGVATTSFVAGLYGIGLATSNYPIPGTDPDADLTSWFVLVNAGEPYDENPLAADIVDEITRHHSSYYIDPNEPPAALLISNGWTDDLFPADEAIRFYNRTRAIHPGTPIAMMFTDHGHQRGQNKGADGTFRSRQRKEWFDFYVKGTGPQPFLGVQTLTQTCGAPSGGATGEYDDPDSDLPFQAPTWADLAPGEIRIEDPVQQIIAPAVPTDGPLGQAFDPIAGGGACATTDATDQTGAATYRSAPAPAGGFTLMGSPTIVADILSVGPTSQVAARLLDVNPSTNEQTLVARGLYRPEVNTVETCQVFQLHANGWHFAEGHIAKLELLPSDFPYGRTSNGQLPVTVSNLSLRLPVLESAGALGGLVQAPADKVVPAGYTLAVDVNEGVDASCVPASVATPTPTPGAPAETPTPTETPGPGATPTPTPTFSPGPAICAGSPVVGCSEPAVSNKAKVQLKNKTPDSRDRLKWDWLKGTETMKMDFGMPDINTSYALCMYDGHSMKLLAATVPPGGLCRNKPCWKNQKRGYRFNDRDLSNDGIQKIQLKEGIDGKAKIQVKGKGATIDMPTLPIQALPVVVQFVNSNGQCWQATYSGTLRNEAEQFKAKAD